MESKKIFEPVADKVILKEVDGAAMSDGGVIIPDTSQEGTQMGEVVAVGPGAIMIDGSYCKMQTKPGDIVVYPKFGAKKLEYKGDDYLILKENDVLTILTEEKTNE